MRGIGRGVGHGYIRVNAKKLRLAHIDWPGAYCNIFALRKIRNAEYQGTMAIKEMVRGGGRSARIQAAVHAAVKELSAETERGELTVPQIAAHAGVTPSTIYRRWGDLQGLLADVAVERLRPIADPEDTGSTRGDLEAWAEQYFEEMSSEVGKTLLRDVLTSAADPCNSMQCWRYSVDQFAIIAARARARGEKPFDIDEAIDQLVAPMVYHILFGDRVMSAAGARALVGRLRSLS